MKKRRPRKAPPLNRATKRRLRKLVTQAARLVLKGDIDGAEALCRTHGVPMGLVERHVADVEASSE